MGILLEPVGYSLKACVGKPSFEVLRLLSTGCEEVPRTKNLLSSLASLFARSLSDMTLLCMYDLTRLSLAVLLRHEGWCKYCATLEKELTNSLEVKEKWADENSWEDVKFKQADQYFESRMNMSIAEQDSRKRKYGLVRETIRCT